MDNKGTKKTAIILFLVTILMFGFGYAMVPLYDVFCKITGLNGKTIRVVESEEKKEYKTDRIVKLKSNVKTMKVQPGKFYEATYVVENLYNGNVTGQAIPSVSPQVASLYFKKAECFCFINQLLKPGEVKEMVVRFEVDKDLPEEVTALTLSYTFFRAKKVAVN
jgi:cytochrome c oxidase assembly protein subunit 11